jgi:hypothetical protein
VSNKFGSILEEKIVKYFKVMSWHSPVGAEENHEKPQSG